MEINIHTRHATLADDFRSISEEKLHSMERFSVQIDRIDVEVTHEQNPHQGKHAHKVVIASHGGGPALRAEATEFNDVAAFDVAIKSIELQIRKIHEMNKDYKRETIRTMPLAD